MNKDQTSTIVAQATARGNGGIAIIRLSGPQSHAVLRDLFVPTAQDFTDFVPWRLHHGHIQDQDKEILDEVLCVFMPGPKTYTGEDCAEIHCHGGQTIVSLIVEACLRWGIEAATKGEFTRRAFLNGRMNLSQAEAVAELIAAPSKEAVRHSLRRLDGELGRRVRVFKEVLETLRGQMSLAIDFPEDEVEIIPRDHFAAQIQTVIASLEELLRGVARAKISREGALVVLAGNVNAGKSSIMNALLGRERALVTALPGTTRDFLEESVDCLGLPVRLVDTAGVREASDPVEALGIERSREKISEAHCLLVVLDGASLGADAALLEHCPDATFDLALAQNKPVIVVWNKVDLCQPALPIPRWCHVPFVTVSARHGQNLDELCRLVHDAIVADLPASEDVAPNDRQAVLLEKALQELYALASDIEGGQMYDLLSVRLDAACLYLDDVIGVGSAQDVLNSVFAKFCIGK